MKKIFFILFSFLAVSTVLFSQTNVLKGRAFYILPVFSDAGPIVGIGYEKIFPNHFSLQMLYNWYKKEFDSRIESSQNGVFSNNSQTITREIIPECRYYFGSKDDLRNASFVGIYGISRTTKNEDNVNIQFFSANSFLTKKISDIGIGGLIGQNLSMTKRLNIEAYIGVTYAYAQYKKVGRFGAAQSQSSFGKYARVGLNMCYRF